MLQRAIRDVFDALAAMHESGEAEVELRVQFVEVSNAASIVQRRPRLCM